MIKPFEVKGLQMILYDPPRSDCTGAQHVVNSCCLKLRIFEKMAFSKVLKVHTVKLTVRIWVLASSEDISMSFEYFDVKKGTQKVETSDVNLMYHTKWSLKYIKWFLSKSDFQVISSPNTIVWPLQCTSERHQTYKTWFKREVTIKRVVDKLLT